MHQKNAMFYPPKKVFGPPNSLGKWVECSCDPLDKNNSIMKHLHKFSCQNVEPQWAIQLAFGVCTLSHISNHIYAKNQSHQMLNLDRQCKHKGWSYTIIKIYFTFTKTNILVFIQSLYLSGHHWLESTPSHEFPIQQNMTTSHFDISFHSNYLQIAQLMCLWANIHVGLMFIVILIAGEWSRHG